MNIFLSNHLPHNVTLLTIIIKRENMRVTLVSMASLGQMKALNIFILPIYDYLKRMLRGKMRK